MYFATQGGSNADDRVFFVVNYAGTLTDYVYNYSVPGDANCGSAPTLQYSVAGPASRLGPRLATTFISATGDGWLFAVVPSTASTKAGTLYGMKTTNQGDNVGTWQQISAVGWEDSNFPPVAAAPLNMRDIDNGNAPMVVTRTASGHGIDFYYFDGAGWLGDSSVSLPAPAASVGDSIAIAQVPPQPVDDPACVDLGSCTGFNWILVSGTDGHLYGTRVFEDIAWPGVDITARQGGGNWKDFGEINPALGTTIDSGTDSLAASGWNDQFGTPSMSVYARGDINGTSYAPWTTVIVSANPTSNSYVVGWQNLTGATGWLGGAFAGGSSIIPTGIVGAYDWVFSLCAPRGFCEFQQTGRNPPTALQWSYP
jgi:hypothetical protein